MQGFKYTYGNARPSNGLTGVELYPCDGDAANSVFHFLGPAAEGMEPFHIGQAVEKWIQWGNADDTNYNLWCAIQNVIWGLDREGKGDQAFGYLVRMLPWVPNYEALCSIGTAINKHVKEPHQYKALVESYRECQVRLPKTPKIHYAINNNMGYCLFMLNEFAEAEKCCREAIGLIPDEYHAHKNLAAALLGQCRFGEAATCLLQALEVAPGDDGAVKVVEMLLAKVPQLSTEAPEVVGRIRDLLRKPNPAAQGEEATGKAGAA